MLTPNTPHATNIEIAKAITRGDYGDPFSILGMHDHGPEGSMVVRVFFPEADKVEIIDKKSGQNVGALEKLLPEGFFAGVIGRRKKRFAYRLEITIGAETLAMEDPYHIGTILTDAEVQAMIAGNFWRSYEKLGAHLTKIGGVSGVTFAVWAPNAARVSVVGDFNNWDGRRHVMRLRHRCSVWEIFIAGLAEGDVYMYEIKDRQGRLQPLKADPYGFAAELPPRRGSVIRATDSFKWADKNWMKARAKRNAKDAPISTYEVHLGSWRRVPEEDNRFLTYRELADQLVPYVKEMGFTHVELMPVNEYPYYGSWGYQPVGIYAPTSRFGTPEDFKHLVERFHQEGIGVLLDWVPAHFPSDNHGLSYFDGTHLYEHSDPRQGVHPDWQTLLFNYRRNEVAQYLISNALFWLDRYHIDGLRVDAVASMLYLDYSRQPGGWIPNEHGGNTNLDAINLLRNMNELVHGEFEGAITIAEESTAWPGVTAPTARGGLGFTYKWNMGWMHDTLSYMSLDPIHRRYHHHKLTFGMIYAYNEHFVLPLSHDEVVHLKRSLIGKMPGDRWRRFANLRAYYAFMWAHPGKKLLFMGGELAQEREWNHEASLDWHLLEEPYHRGIHHLVRDLNALYRGKPALYELDAEPSGFKWVKANQEVESYYAFLRLDSAGGLLLVACNMTPVPRSDIRFGVPKAGSFCELLNSDDEAYGGSGMATGEHITAVAEALDGLPFCVTLSLPPLATVILEWQP